MAVIGHAQPRQTTALVIKKYFKAVGNCRLPAVNCGIISQFPHSLVRLPSSFHREQHIALQNILPQENFKQIQVDHGLTERDGLFFTDKLSQLRRASVVQAETCRNGAPVLTYGRWAAEWVWDIYAEGRLTLDMHSTCQTGTTPKAISKLRRRSNRI